MLQIEELQIAYRIEDASAEAVRGVSFSAAHGRVLGIAGESGCGKSSVARAILGILPPTAIVSGRIMYGGRNLLAMKRRELDTVRGSEISMVFQDPSAALNPERKIKRQLYDILGGGGRREMDSRIKEMLAAAKLTDTDRIMNSYPGQLSGGMRQRVAIAAALIKNPRIVIADEPTSALDAAIRVGIIEQLTELRERKGLTMIYISHNLAELKKICDDIIIMRDGLIIERGLAGEVFKNPRHEYTKHLIEAVTG